MATYDVEEHWSRVAREIESRAGESHLAGDDSPYFEYKRHKFLSRFFDSIDFRDKTVLEVGFGPGGNLKRLAERGGAKRILGVDISREMLELATRNLSEHAHIAKLHKIDGVAFPFDYRSVDLTYSVTVLQHNTSADMFTELVAEMCRVTATTVIAMEDIGNNGQRAGSGDWTGRRVEVYRDVFSENGFDLTSVDFLNTQTSRRWHKLSYDRIYKRFVNRTHREGEPMPPWARRLMGAALALTSRLDDLLVERRGLARMQFERR